MNELTALLFQSVTPLSQISTPTRKYGRSPGQTSYDLSRKESVEAIRARILEALTGPGTVSCGMLATSLGEHRCKVLKHLYWLEAGELVTRSGTGKNTKWRKL